MRDALVAGVTLNIFNKHSDRVKMANLAQIVNVLQAVILTEGEKMVKTPTYHVFNMYKYHQDADLVESSIETETIGSGGEWRVPNLTESASVDQDGRIHITLTNLSATEDYDIEAQIEGDEVRSVSATILSGEMHDMNTFEEPECVQQQKFEEIQLSGSTLLFRIPRCSVLHIEARR